MFAVRCQFKNAGEALAFVENALILFSVLQMCGIAIIAKYIGNAQKVWIEGIQTRVDVTASMLSSMKVQKLWSEIRPRLILRSRLRCSVSRVSYKTSYMVYVSRNLNFRLCFAGSSAFASSWVLLSLSYSNTHKLILICNCRQ